MTIMPSHFVAYVPIGNRQSFRIFSDDHATAHETMVYCRLGLSCMGTAALAYRHPEPTRESAENGSLLSFWTFVREHADCATAARVEASLTLFLTVSQMRQNDSFMSFRTIAPSQGHGKFLSFRAIAPLRGYDSFSSLRMTTTLRGHNSSLSCWTNARLRWHGRVLSFRTVAPSAGV